MKILVAYVAVTHGPITYEYCERFASTWQAFPPGEPCVLMVVCNGGPLEKKTADLFEPLKPKFYPRTNDEGKDIAAYQDVARHSYKDADILVCFGESVYFHKKDWLKPLVNAWNNHGRGLYGFLSSNLVRPHLNTTAFACDPLLLGAYPMVEMDLQRREFEHGDKSLVNTLRGLHRPVRLVTWDDSYGPEEWRTAKNIFWRGDQSNTLVHCNHTDRFRDADEPTKKRWRHNADVGLTCALF